MSLIALLIAIIILVFIHELGHFLMAQLTGCRVDEFAVGFKPAVFQKKWGATNYVLGWIPIGGYVKIWGENGSEEVENDKDNPQAFYNRPRPAQALVLFGGVLFNFILAWLLFSILLMQGKEVSQAQFPDEYLEGSRTTAVNVLTDFPAEQAGVQLGDTIARISTDGESTTGLSGEMTTFVQTHKDQVLQFDIIKVDGSTSSVSMVTQEYQDRYVVGIVMDDLGTLQLPFFDALIAGAVMTRDFSVTIIHAFVDLIGGLFAGTADVSQLAGPVGIAGIAGDSLSAGVGSFVWFLAILSLNLAIFNLLPIPALDGGRLVFVAIESVIRRPIDPKWFMWVNIAGFMFLIGLMILVTILDVSKWF